MTKEQATVEQVKYLSALFELLYGKPITKSELKELCSSKDIAIENIKEFEEDLKDNLEYGEQY